MTERTILIPAGIASDREALFDAYHDRLQTPWRPRNWDGLFDFLCDLAWLPAGNLLVLHEGRPLTVSRADASLYADLVTDVNRSWLNEPQGRWHRWRLSEGLPALAPRTVRIVPPTS